MPLAYEADWTLRSTLLARPPAPKTIGITINLQRQLSGFFFPHELFAIAPGEHTVAVINASREDLCNDTDLITEPVSRMTLDLAEQFSLICDILDMVNTRPNLSEIFVQVRLVFRRVVPRDEEVRVNPVAREAIAGIEMVKVGDGEDSSCVICLEKLPPAMEVSRIPCSHVFHGDCITQWLEINNVCPVCRFKVTLS